MKIRNVNRSEGGIKSLREVESHGNTAAKAVVFKKTFSDMTKQQRESHLNSLIEEIEEQGTKLGKKADIKEFEIYRKLIRKFIEDVVSNGYEFSKESAFGIRGRHRFYATVRTIDKKLDALAKEVLSDQKNNLSIISKIDDIRGLILDLLV